MLSPLGHFSCGARCLDGLRADARVDEGGHNGDYGGEEWAHQGILRAEVDARDEEQDLVLTVQASIARHSGGAAR